MSKKFIFSISFLSSCLIFIIEPLFTRQITPKFGGSSNVWALAITGFQFLLLAGYIFANWLISLPVQIQKRLYVTVTTTICLLAFVTLGLNLAPHPFFITNPYLHFLFLMTTTVAGPFFILSTTTSILHNYLNTQKHSSPYLIYAISNIGSLAGLFAYPLIIEPLLPLSLERPLWLIGFYLVCVSLYFYSAKSSHPRNPATHYPTKTLLTWIGLAAVPALLLVTATNALTSEIGSLPLIWSLPLAAYLLSFVIAFSGQKINLSTWVKGGLGLYIILHVVSLLGSAPILLTVPLNFALVFCLATIFHYHLYQLRPADETGPKFYIFTSLGGVIGSLVVSLLFPNLLHFQKDFVFVSSAIMIILTLRFFSRLALPFKVASFSILLIIFQTISVLSSYKYLTRNFYGDFSVNQKDHITYLISGNTVHGAQITTSPQTPTTYYHADSGLGFAIQFLPHPKKMAAVGLGAGTVSAYCLPPDSLTYFEINPSAVYIAQTYFSFLKNCPNTNIVLGDARLELAKSTETFDIIILDAFSGDSVPFHLLTKEAFAIYSSHLNKDGQLLVHISNRYFNLRPIVFGQAHILNKDALSLNIPVKNQPGLYTSEWVIISSDSILLDLIASKANPNSHLERLDSKKYPLWTDDFYSPISVLKL